MEWGWWVPFGRVDETVPEALLQDQLNGRAIQIVDVRERFEYLQGHIQGALNVPLHDLKGTLPLLCLDKKRPVVAICLSGHRSIPAVRLLRKAGFRQASGLKGGMLRWWQRNLPTTRDSDGPSD